MQGSGWLLGCLTCLHVLPLWCGLGSGPAPDPPRTLEPLPPCLPQPHGCPRRLPPWRRESKEGGSLTTGLRSRTKAKAGPLGNLARSDPSFPRRRPAGPLSLGPGKAGSRPTGSPPHGCPGLDTHKAQRWSVSRGPGATQCGSLPWSSPGGWRAWSPPPPGHLEALTALRASSDVPTGPQGPGTESLRESSSWPPFSAAFCGALESPTVHLLGAVPRLGPCSCSNRVRPLGRGKGRPWVPTSGLHLGTMRGGLGPL